MERHGDTLLKALNGLGINLAHIKKNRYFHIYLEKCNPLCCCAWGVDLPRDRSILFIFFTMGWEDYMGSFQIFADREIWLKTQNHINILSKFLLIL